MKWTYDERRVRLEALELDDAAWVMPSYHGTDVDALLAACKRHGMEGVVLKHRRSIDRPGQRSADWRKIKRPVWAESLERRRPRDHSERGGATAAPHG